MQGLALPSKESEREAETRESPRPTIHLEHTKQTPNKRQQAIAQLLLR
jgi:hypothetical protein